MRVRQQRVVQLRTGVERALRALGHALADPAHDGWLDDAGLARALAEPEAVLVRAALPLEGASGEFAPEPRDAVWVRIEPDGELRWCPLRPEGEPAVKRSRARAVLLRRRRERCCDGAKCKRHKRLAQLAVTLEDGELLIAERLGDEGAPEPLAATARALAARLEVPLEGVEDGEAADARPARGAPLSAEMLARWALRREDGLFVLRDHASFGPREAARREWIAAAVLFAGALGGWAAVAQAWRAESWERLSIAGAVAVVLSLASWAMLQIAAYSTKYTGTSEALLTAARDRLVLAPWVSRQGAVGTRPEGRYGAALPLAEVHELSLEPGRDGWTLVLTSEHGPYHVGTLDDEGAAQAWRDALERVLAAVAHGDRKPRPTTGARHAALVALCAVLAGCSGERPTPHGPPPLATSAAAIASAPASVPAAAASAPPPAPPVARPALALIDDDVPAALERAKQEGRAVFVEVWAPWCHTCLSMKSFVLPDPAIAALSDRVVFAAIDSDRPENAAFMERYEVNVWPTLYVLDADGAVLGMWAGAASVEELRSFIVASVDAREALRDPHGPVAAMVAAGRAHAARRHVEAAVHYRRALERGGEGWPRRSEALLGLLDSEYRQGQFRRCAELGMEHVGAITGAAVPTDFASRALACAARAKDPDLHERARTAVRARLEEHTRHPPAAASVDDRADALALLSRVRRETGDEAGARQALVEQLALLEQAAAAAPSPEAAATFDYARMNSYLSLGRGEEAVALLTERRRQLPDSYEPPARLAQALEALGRLPEALAAADDAVAKSYGPRKLRYLGLQASLRGRVGDTAGRRRALEQLLAAYEALDEAAKKHPLNKELADDARAALAKLR